MINILYFRVMFVFYNEISSIIFDTHKQYHLFSFFSLILFKELNL